MAVRLAERPFRFHVYRIEVAFDHNLGFGRHHQIDGARAHDIDRRAGETAGNADFIDVDRQLLRRDEGHAGGRAEHDRARHRLVAALLMLDVMPVTAGAAHPCGHAHDQPVRRL